MLQIHNQKNEYGPKLILLTRVNKNRLIVDTNVASRQQGLVQSTGGAGGGAGAGGGDRSASHARLGTAGAVQQPGPTPDQHLFCNIIK